MQQCIAATMLRRPEPPEVEPTTLCVTTIKFPQSTR